LMFRTLPGTKLAGAVLGRSVAFEIDGASPDDRGVDPYGKATGFL